MPIQQQDFQAVGNAGHQIGQSLVALQRLKQQQAFQQQQANQHMMMQMPEMMHQQALTQQVQQKMKDDALAQQVAQTIGNARTAGANLGVPGIAGNGYDASQAAMSMLNGVGIVPDGGVPIAKEDLIMALSNLAQGLGTQQAMSTPSTAASMMAPRNVPQGDISINSLGNVIGMGMSKPQTPDFSYVPQTQYQPGGSFNRQTGSFAPQNPDAGAPGRFAPQANDATKLNALVGAGNFISGYPQAATNQAAPVYQAITNMIPRLMGQPNGPALPQSAGAKQLSKEQAMQFLRQAGGDKDKARALAKQSGFTF